MEQSKEYYAFISYKREDEKWARWLANELEHYHLPTTLNGKEMPKNLRPVFRDVDELSAGNLPKQIYHALSISKNLIVLCSPRSAKSEWVDKEISDFIKIKGGDTDNIYPFIIEGVPFSKDAETECFPEALRNLPENEERLGGNINEVGGKYVAVVKTIAGMLGVSHDSLWNRYERERRKKRISMIIVAAIVFLCISSIAFWMYWQKQQTEKANLKTMAIQSRFVAEKASLLVEDGDTYTASKIAMKAIGTAYTFEAEVALRKASVFEKKVLIGHTKQVISASFSPDGKYIVSTSFDKTLRFWNVETGKQIREPIILDYSVFSASFSPNCKYVISPYDDVVRIWDVKTGKWVRDLFGHEWSVNFSSFSPDSIHIVSASNDKTVRIWNVKTGEQVGRPLVHTESVLKALYSPNGKYIVSASYDNLIWIWDIKTGKQIGNPFEGHTDYISSVSFSPDSKYIVSASSDKTIRIWDVATGKQIGNSLEGHISDVTSASFSPDGRYIVSASTDKTVRIWDVKTFKQIGSPLGHGDCVNSASFSPDGNYIVSACGDNYVRIWDTADIQQLGRLLEYPDSECVYASITPDGKFIVSAGNHTVKILNTITGKLIGSPIENASWGTHALSHDGHYYAAGTSDIKVWDVENGKQINNIAVGKYIRAISFSPDGRHVVTASNNKNDNTVRIWDVHSGKPIGVPLVHSSSVQTVSYSSDGKYIVSASLDGGIYIWDVTKRRQIVKPLNEHELYVTSASFSPDGNYIVSASADKTIIIWDVKTGKKTNRLIGHTATVESAFFSPNGNYIISSSMDKTVRIWDVKTGKQVGSQFEGNSFNLRTAVFCPDGRHIASASTDAKIRIWTFLPLLKLIDETSKKFKESPLTLEELRKYYLE